MLTTNQWLFLELLAGLAIGVNARSEGLRLGGWAMAGVALLYLFGGPS